MFAALHIDRRSMRVRLLIFRGVAGKAVAATDDSDDKIGTVMSGQEAPHGRKLNGEIVLADDSAAPYGRQNFVAADNTLAMIDQELKHIERACMQRQHGVFHKQPPSPAIDAKLVKVDYAG